jgi:uncharacterized membrane protein YoaK (UPF0700 family)
MQPFWRVSLNSGRYYVLSVAVFLLVLFLTRLLAGGLEQTGVPAMQPLLLLQLLLLVVFFSICVVAGPYRDTDAILAVIAGMLVSRRWQCSTRSCRFR